MSNTQDLRFKRTNQMLCSTFIELLSKKKYDFFAYFIRQNRERFAGDWIQPENGRELSNFFIFMFRQMILYLTEHRSMVRNIANSSAFPILLDILAEEICTSLAGEIKKNDDGCCCDVPSPEIAAAYYAGGIIQILRCWITAGGNLKEETLIRQYTQLLMGIPSVNLDNPKG